MRFSYLLQLSATSLLLNSVLQASALDVVDSEPTFLTSLCDSYDIYIETYFKKDYHSLPASLYVIAALKGKYELSRSYYEPNHLWILETSQDPKQPVKDVRRYYQSEGFVVFREVNDKERQDQKEMKARLEQFLTSEGNRFGVFFYDYKYLQPEPWSVVCQCRLFTPGMDSGYAYVEKKRLVNGWEDSIGQACYLIYYSFVSDHEELRDKFAELSDCIYFISNGQVLRAPRCH